MRWGENTTPVRFEVIKGKGSEMSGNNSVNSGGTFLGHLNREQKTKLPRLLYFFVNTLYFYYQCKCSLEKLKSTKPRERSFQYLVWTGKERVEALGIKADEGSHTSNSASW